MPSTPANAVLPEEAEMNDTSPDSSTSSPSRKSAKSKPASNPPPKPQRAVDILRQVAMEIDPNTYTIPGNGDETRMKEELSSHRDSISGDTCSLSSSVFSDTVNFTADYQLNTPKHELPHLAKPNKIKGTSNHGGYTSDGDLVDYGTTTFSTFKGPRARNGNNNLSNDNINRENKNGQSAKLKDNQRSQNRIEQDDFNTRTSIKEGIVDNETLSVPDSEYRTNDKHHVSTSSPYGHTQTVTSANKSWQDVTATSDYSMEMLRKDESINPNTIEFSIVDEKTANDTNNNLEPDLFDGVEREKVGQSN